MKLRSFLAILAGALLIPSLACAEAPVLAVTQIQGEATILSADGTTKPAAAGAQLLPTDKIESDANGQVDVALNGVAGCRLLAGTSASLAGTDDKNMTLTVAKGNVVLNLQKLPSGTRFELVTPQAVAAVRGTQFWGRVLPVGEAQSGTTFAVREGAVEITVKSTGQSFTVNQGEALDIPPGEGAIPAVRPALDEELAAIAQASNIATSV